MPIDLGTLAVLASLFFGAVVGDAVLFGDPLQVQISVPAKLEEAGFTEAVAEEAFAAEVAHYGQAISIVHTPDVQLSSRTSVFAAMARPLHLEGVVVALQKSAGVGVVTVRGAVIERPTGGGLELVVFITQPHEVNAKVKVEQPDGDAAQLLEHGSRLVLEQIAPYRVALTDFAEGLHGEAGALTRAEAVATQALARPWSAARATQQVMLHNLLGLIAVFQGDLAAADAQFQQSETIPEALPASHAVVAFNRAFIAVAQKRPAEAVAHFKIGLAYSDGADVAGFQARIATLGGLVAWSAGDLAKATGWFRRAMALRPYDDAPHAYLTQVLGAQGDAAGAALEREAAASRRGLEREIPALIQSDFWVDPVAGGIKRRD